MRKVFFFSRSLLLCFREWMDDGMAMRGQKLFLIARYCWWEMACMCVSQIHHCQSIVNSWQLWLMGDFEHENWITVELILYKASRYIAFLIRLCNKSYHYFFSFLKITFLFALHSFFAVVAPLLRLSSVCCGILCEINRDTKLITTHDVCVCMYER